LKIGICHANTHPPTAGIGNFAYNIARELSDDNYEFYLFLRGNNRYKTEVSDNFTIHWCPYFRAYPFNNHIHRVFVDRKMQRMSKSLDMLHLHSPISPPVKTDLPTVTTVHTSLSHKREVIPTKTFSDYLNEAQSIVGRRIERYLINKSRKTTTVSESIKKHLSEKYTSENDIVVTPNGVDTAEFNPSKNNDGKYRMLYTGRLAAVKGLPDLIQAIDRLNTDRSKWELVITGKGDYRDVLENQAEELGVEDKIEFTGFLPRNELVNYYENSDIFVFPSYYEGLPTSVLEAMAAGLPTVSTTAPGVRDLIDHGKTGLLGPPGDVDQLVSNLDNLLQDSSLRKQMGKEARIDAEKSYDWGIVSERMKSVYESL